jgi:thymidylate synthase ThyX
VVKTLPWSTRILLDSVAPCGKRLTTWELTYPRFVHSEYMTHRLFSRNAASSRAIPIEKVIERVLHEPAMPYYWGKNQKGMQAAEELEAAEKRAALDEWLAARDSAVAHAQKLMAMGVHKQIVNRLLEPFVWITVICTATEFGNWFHLRTHPDAQPEIRVIAQMMVDVYYKHPPTPLKAGEWHMPLIRREDRADICRLLEGQLPAAPQSVEEALKRISVARCARISYLTHDGVRDIQKDLDLYDRLVNGSGGAGHWSPFEHVAMALDEPLPSGNFIGWKQFRKCFENEHHAEYMQKVHE